MPVKEVICPRGCGQERAADTDRAVTAREMAAQDLTILRERHKAALAEKEG